MKFITIAIFIMILVPLGSAFSNPVDGVDYQSESVATADQITAGLINPAGLAFWDDIGIHYTHNFHSTTYKGDDAFLASSQGGFFSIEWLKRDDNIFRRKFTFALSDRIFPNFYLGISYSMFNGDNAFYKNRKDWKIGMLYHPKPFASLGLVVDRLNEPRFGGRKQWRLYRPGIALRPIGEKLTIWADGRWNEGDEISRSQGNFGLKIGPFKGVMFNSEYRTEGQWRVGVTFLFDQYRTGVQGNINSSNKYSGGSYFVEITGKRNQESMADQGKTGILNLTGPIKEEPPQGFLGSRGTSFFDIIDAIHEAANDKNINSLILRFDAVKTSFASAEELKNSLIDFRKTGKPIIAYIDNGGNLDYYLATVADKIYMNPTGLLELDGLSATATYYKGTMDKLGIKAQMIHTGPHKTFGDAFTQTELSKEAREQLDWLLDDLYAQFVEGISASRKILSEDVKKIIDAGPYTPKDAYDSGLIDGLKHYDEIIKTKDLNMAGPVDICEFYKKDYSNTRWKEPQHIAIVYADGAIKTGRSGQDLFMGKTMGSTTVSDALKKIRNDKNIMAIVLRVNSPGGDGFASDEIFRELELIKGKKPLIISMGGVAASGGYYISCIGDDILVSPATITGSIGVIEGKMDLSGFYEKIGINKQTLKRGIHADIRSSTRGLTDEEISKAKKMINQFYESFVDKVSTWRKIPYDSVDAIGQGRVWTGHQALQKGLVDSYGGIWDAINLARTKAGIDSEDHIIIDSYPKYPFSIRQLFEFPSIGWQVAELIEGRDNESIAYKMPFDLDIK